MPATQQRRGTAAELQAANETPLAGQIYFEIDTNRVKIGDGSRAFNALPYLSDSTTIADIDGLQAALDANAAAAAAAQSSTDGLSSQFAQHKSRHAITGTDPLSPADIGAAPDSLVGEVNTLESDLFLARLDLNNVITISGQNTIDIAGKASKTANNTFIGTQNFTNSVSFVPYAISLQSIDYGGASNGQFLKWNGTTWVPDSITPASIGAQPAGTSTDAVPEGSTNLYFTDARAQTALTGALSTKVDTNDPRLTDARTPLAHTHALADLQQSGAATNDVIAWSGTAWTATAGGGGITTLGGLNDVNISSASTGQHLRYISLTQSWVNSAIPLGDLDGTGVSLGQFARFFNGSWGASTLYLSHIADVSSILPTNGQVLTYNSAQSIWQAQTPAQTTDDLAEGSTNLYYTDARAEAAARGIVGTTANTLCAGDDARLSDARTPTAHAHSQSDITNLTTDLAAKADLVNGTVPASQLPSYVDDILEFANLSSFPATGETGKIYVDLANRELFRWSGSTYTVISPSPGSTDDVAEGSVNLYYTTARAQNAARGIVGTTANTLCAGDDARLSDARTPLAHTHAQSEITNLTTDLAAKVASDTTQAGGGTAVNNIVVITQAAYTALGTKDANTIYFVT